MVLNIGSPPWEFHSVEAGEEAQALVSTVIQTGNVKGWPYFAFFSDRVVGSEEEEYETEHELRVSIDPESGYGAMHWHSMSDPESPYITQAQETPPEVDLVYDGSTGDPFPSSALVPLSAIEAALLGLARSGERPQGVAWQQFDRL